MPTLLDTYMNIKQYGGQNVQKTDHMVYGWPQIKKIIRFNTRKGETFATLDRWHRWPCGA